METIPTQLKFHAPTKADLPQVLHRIAAAVQQLDHHPRWNPHAEYKVNLILEELATNTIQYGAETPLPQPDLAITITPTTEGADLCYQDTGTPFNPLTDAPKPPTPGNHPGDIPIGGQGITLIKHMSRSISYQRTPTTNALLISVSI